MSAENNLYPILHVKSLKQGNKARSVLLKRYKMILKITGIDLISVHDFCKLIQWNINKIQQKYSGQDYDSWN